MPAATPHDITTHNARAAELSRHKLGRVTLDGADGYHRVTCPPPQASSAARSAPDQ
jgi:hypothetical protein